MDNKQEVVVPEQLARWIQDGRNDPVIFINKLLGMPLHQGQIRYLRETQRKKTRINILTCANRWGKSSLLACLHIWYLFYKFGIPKGVDEQSHHAWLEAEYRTANIAPHSALTEPVFKAIHAIMSSSFLYTLDGKTQTSECLIGWFYLPERTLNTPPYKQFFDNNSYIEHRSLGSDQGDSLQGKPYGLISYDEGFRSNHLQNEVDDAILPRLADWQAPLHILSTPSMDSRSSLYAYELYENGLAGVNKTYAQEGSLRQNTFFNKEQLDAQYDLFKNNPMQEQVLEGKFIFGGEAIFTLDDILQAKDNDLDSGVRYEEGHRYAMGIDTAIGNDEMVYTVLDITAKPWRRVWVEGHKGNSRSPQLHLNALCNLVDNYYHNGNMAILLETWNGESVRFYHDLPPYIKQITRTYGAWQPAKPSSDFKLPPSKTKLIKKADLIVILKKALSDKTLKIPASDTQLLKQLQIYREDDKGIPTDRVISLALATWLADEKEKAAQPVWQSQEW